MSLVIKIFTACICLYFFFACEKRRYLGIETSLQDFTERIEGKWLQSSELVVFKDSSKPAQNNLSTGKTYDFYNIQSNSIIKRSDVEVYLPSLDSTFKECKADFYLTEDQKAMHFKIQSADFIVDIVDTAYFESENTLVLKYQDSLRLFTGRFDRQ